MKNCIKFTFLMASIFFMSQVKSQDAGPQMLAGAEEFTQTLDALVKKPWYEFIPSVGSVTVPHEKMEEKRKRYIDDSPLGLSTYLNVQIIKEIPFQMFINAKSPYFWGYAENLNKRPFIAIAFRVQSKDPKTGQWKEIDDKIYSIAYTYIWFKGSGSPAMWGWVTTGGDGARYLGQYEMRTTDATIQDKKDMATLIATGSVVRNNIKIPNELEKSYRLVLAEIK